jgi:riboflavin kinase/FMN adenylyltransferase
VVTIGVFDGVHRGHQQIIGHAARRARELGLRSVVVSFDPHPSEVVRPGSHPAVLTDADRKADLIERLGVLRARRARRAPARRGGGGR